MKVIVGLGNPGVKYANNRHNTGFMVMDKLAEFRSQNLEVSWESKFGALIAKADRLLLVKPQKFMNNSGEVVSEIVNFYKVSTANLWVIHDDLDIRLGEYKIQYGIGPKIHNGVNSIEGSLGKTDFWRVRMGIDNRPVGEARALGEEYVLLDFLSEERKVINGVIERIVRDLLGAVGSEPAGGRI